MQRSSRQDSDPCSNFTQIYSDLHVDAMLLPIQMGTNMTVRNEQKHPDTATKA